MTLTELIRPKHWKGEPVRYAQQKMDGVRILIRVAMDGSITAYTRNGKTDHWPETVSKILGDLITTHVPPDSALDCELHPRDPGQSTDVSNLVAGGEYVKLEVTCFAIPFWGGINLGDQDLESVAVISKSCGIPFAEFIKPLDADQLKSMARSRGWEGFVLKNANYRDWYKLKFVRTAEAFVIGYDVSKSKTKSGWLKGFNVGCIVDGDLTVAHNLGNVGTGYDDDYRKSVDPESMIGKVMEVEFDRLTRDNKFCFPTFVRWRDDKNWQECTLAAIKESQ